jgi:mannosyl-oligosaccharide glucosidase
MRPWWIILAAAPLARASSFSPTNDSALLWGAYRPNLYFGLRPQLPQSLMTGLLWFGTQDYQSIGRECSLPTGWFDEL